MRYIGKKIKLKERDFLKAYGKTEVVETTKKYPSKIKGVKLKGKLASKIGKTYGTTLTEERYIIILQTTMDNPGILDDSMGKASGISQNAGYAHLIYGAHEKIGDFVMKSKRYTITEQGMKTLRHLQKSHKRKGKEIEKEQKAKVTEKLKEELVVPLADDKKIIQTPKKKTGEEEALDKKYAVIARKIAAKSEATGKEYLTDRDALQIYKTYEVTIEKSILDTLQKLIDNAFNHRITYEQLAASSKQPKSISGAHVRYGIRKKMFAPCGYDEKGKPEVCAYDSRGEVVEMKQKKQKIIKVQSKSILDGEKKETIIKVQSKSILDGENKEAEGTSLWKKIRGEKKAE
jgi:hypothetical protein